MSGQDVNRSAVVAGEDVAAGPVLLGSSSRGVPGCEDAKAEDEGLSRAGTMLSRAGTAMQRAGSNLKLQRASTLPTDDKELRHAATMPMTFDVEADRPCCCGLWKLQQMLGFIAGILSLAALVVIRPVQTYPQANDMLGITALCACFWVFEVIPVYMTALFPVVLMPLFKITSSEIAAQAYWNWISLLVVGMFLVDIALEEVHLPRRLALKFLLKTGVVHPAALLACFMGMCWVLSMLLNSIAVTLVITPFAIGLLNAADEQVRDAEAAEAVEAGEPGEQGSGAGSRRNVKDVQKFSDGLLLGIAFSATCGGMATLTGAIPHYFLAGESNLAAHVTWSKWFVFALPVSLVSVMLAFAALCTRYVKSLKFRGISHETLEAEYSDLLNEVGPFSRDELLVGLIQLTQVVLLIIRPFAISPFVQTEYGENLVNDATLACAPALLLFFLPSQVRPGQALLTWPAVHEKFDFGLLLLIGGSLAINSGFTQSGLDVAMGTCFAQLVPHLPTFVLNLAIIACVTLSVQIFSGIGIAAALLPVISSASLEAVVNPLLLLLPATIASSFAFLLPTATPSNVVVLAKSQDLARSLRFRDFFLNGLPVTLVIIIVGAVLTDIMGALVFDSHSPFPKWACSAEAASCVFVQAPGVVQGQQVDAQACIVDLSSVDATMCRLWNGTMLDLTLVQRVF